MNPRWLLTLLWLVISMVLSACTASGGADSDDSEGLNVISGSVAYRERITMPANAVITVQLLDVSQQDSRATVIAEQRIRPSRQVPIPFTLQYDRADVNRRGTYSVAATIEVEGDVVWRTTSAVPVITNGNPTENIELVVTRIE